MSTVEPLPLVHFGYEEGHNIYAYWQELAAEMSAGELQVLWRAGQEQVETISSPDDAGEEDREEPARSVPRRPASASGGYLKRLRRINSRGAVLILLLNTLVDASYYGAIGQVFKRLLTEKHDTQPPGLAYFIQVSSALAVPQILYPLAGWLADARFGRYKTIRASLWLLWAGFLILFVSFTVEYVEGDETWAGAVAFYVAFPISFLLINSGLAGFHTNVIPFGMDQMPHASGLEISTFVYYYYWTRTIGTGVFVTILSCTTFRGLIVVIQSFTELFCVSVGLVLCYGLKKWLIIEPHSQSPVGTVCRVLKFAAQHKSPLRRSAFTYWEEKLPSRINLAKDKYGGPFSSESVEDVKSFLNIAAVLLALGGYIIVYYEDDILFLSHLDDEGIDNDECSASELLVGSVRKLTILLSLPLYELLYPLIFKYIPSGVRRIGLGMVIAGLAAATIVVTDVAGHVMVPGNATMCHLINSTAEPIDIPVYWIILPYILSGIAEMLVFISALEFICAQSPYNMRGMLIGTYYSFRGLFVLLGSLLLLMITFIFYFRPHTPYCGMIYYLLVAVIAACGLVIYVLVSRKYRRRERDDQSELRQYGFVEQYYGTLSNEHDSLPTT